MAIKVNMVVISKLRHDGEFTQISNKISEENGNITIEWFNNTKSR